MSSGAPALRVAPGTGWYSYSVVLPWLKTAHLGEQPTSTLRAWARRARVSLMRSASSGKIGSAATASLKRGGSDARYHAWHGVLARSSGAPRPAAVSPGPAARAPRAHSGGGAGPS